MYHCDLRAHVNFVSAAVQSWYSHLDACSCTVMVQSSSTVQVHSVLHVTFAAEFSTRICTIPAFLRYSSHVIMDVTIGVC